MFANLAAGSVLVVTTILVHSVGLTWMSRMLQWSVARLALHRHGIGATSLVVVTVLGLFLLHSIEIWLWALAMCFSARCQV
jgi:hypothetical protein